MLTDDYTVRLDQFQGPLDLLLYLARKAEVDLIDFPLARIADQYIAHLQGVEHIDIDLAGEFLVMAATLMELKSRLISPAPRPDDAEASLPESSCHSSLGSETGVGAIGVGGTGAAPVDLRSQLIEQLLVYRQVRDRADALERQRERWRLRFPTARAATDREALLEAAQRRSETVELDDLGVFDLIGAYERVLERVDFDSLGAHHVSLGDDDTPIELHAADLVDLLSRAGGAPIALRSAFVGRTRGQVVGLFVATLELVRQRRVRLEQSSTDGEILLTLRPDDDEGQTE